MLTLPVYKVLPAGPQGLQTVRRTAEQPGGADRELAYAHRGRSPRPSGRQPDSP